MRELFNEYMNLVSGNKKLNIVDHYKQILFIKYVIETVGQCCCSYELNDKNIVKWDITDCKNDKLTDEIIEDINQYWSVLYKNPKYDNINFKLYSLKSDNEKFIKSSNGNITFVTIIVTIAYLMTGERLSISVHNGSTVLGWVKYTGL